jgi:hypothetical protein
VKSPLCPLNAVSTPLRTGCDCEYRFFMEDDLEDVKKKILAAAVTDADATRVAAMLNATSVRGKCSVCPIGGDCSSPGTTSYNIK